MAIYWLLHRFVNLLMQKRVAAMVVWLVTTGLAQTTAPTSTTNVQKELTLRVRPDVRPETLRYLASVVEPQREMVPANESLTKVLDRLYGSSHSKLRALFISYNPDWNEVDPIVWTKNRASLDGGAG